MFHISQLSFQNFKTNSCCVGGRQRFAKTNTYADISSKDNRFFIGFCSISKRKKSLIASGNTVADGLDAFFKSVGEIGLTASKKVAANVLRILGRALEIGADVGSAFASRSPKVIKPNRSDKILSEW